MAIAITITIVAIMTYGIIVDSIAASFKDAAVAAVVVASETTVPVSSEEGQYEPVPAKLAVILYEPAIWGVQL